VCNRILGCATAFGGIISVCKNIFGHHMCVQQHFRGIIGVWSSILGHHDRQCCL